MKNQKSSKKLTMEELCKKLGIPFKDTTEEHLGQTSIHFSTKPSSSAEESEATGDEPPKRSRKRN